MSKKKLVYFSKYIDEEINNENLNFLISEKDVQYGFWYWIIYGYLISLEEHKVNLNNKKQMLHLSQRFRRSVNETIEILEVLTDYELLIKDIYNDDIFVFSKDVLNEIDTINKKSEIAQNNANSRWNKNNNNTNNSPIKPIEIEKPIVKEEKDTKDIKSPYYCNPRYKETRKALEQLINDKFEIAPEFHMIKSNMQKSALKNLFDLVNVGIINITSPIKVSNWLEDRFDEILSMKKKKPFYLSELNNLIVDLIQDQNFRILNEHCYTNFKKSDFISIHSNEDGYFGTNDNKFKLRVDIEEPIKPIPTIEITDEDDSKNPFEINDEMIPLDEDEDDRIPYD